MGMTATAFALKWANNRRTERAAAQEHFIDLCRVLDEPTPNEADPKGEWYAFEKGAAKLNGGDGYADVWKRNHFAWEYKGKRKNLEDAYRQLALYREALENPPGLVVCDMDRFEVHTNFTSTAKEVHRFDLEELKSKPERPLRILRALMREPEELRPAASRAQITEEAATRFAELAERLRKRKHDPMDVARFLNRVLFCFFAEDSELLPKGIVARILQGAKRDPDRTSERLRELFANMARKGGGYFGPEYIQWFNGGLFEDDNVLPLRGEDVRVIEEAATLDWSSVEPAILGTLFERGLDPKKRAQLGAHYTDIESIRRVIDPVMMLPLRRDFEAMKDQVEQLLARGKRPTAQAKGKENPNRIYREFLKRLRDVRVLDPACGSGNFLYVALRALKDLEKEAIVWAMGALKLTGELPDVGPHMLRGIEVNSYAAELARVTIWIGEIQWMLANGFNYLRDPILRPLQSIECRDAIVETLESGESVIPAWPETEFIVGNPPFLGGKKLRRVLSSEYVDTLFKAWDGKIGREADLVAYWHERSRQQIASGKARRAGLLATQGIRSGANLDVLKKIKESGNIFMAWSDEPWVVEGADVRVSIVGQDDGAEKIRLLDGARVEEIHADLAGGSAGSVDVTQARPLRENLGLAFMGDTKGGSFDISAAAAETMLNAPVNINARPNSDVVVPWVNGLDITRRPRGMHIIDFGTGMSEEDASQYELPFEHIRREVLPERKKNRRPAYRERYWLHVEPRPAMRRALKPLTRFIATPRVAKHRLFVWLSPPTVADSQVIVIARDDWYSFGVLHSRVHEVWALAKCSWLGVGNDPRYTPTTTFETFPFPWPLDPPEAHLTTKQRQQRQRIAEAAEQLDALRQKWLNPPIISVEERNTRTLTNLYNARPAWLESAHRALDRAVLDAYGWPEEIIDQELLKRLLKLNQERPAHGTSEGQNDDGGEDIE